MGIPDLIYPPYPAPVLPGPKASDVSASRRIVREEMLPVLEESGLVCGQASRAYCHGGSKLLHPVVHLHILNRMDKLYLQKRSMKKDLLPGYWDTAVGGHISYGEGILEALYREASEELKFYDFNPVKICDYIFESEAEREMVFVFAAVGDFRPEPDHDEVDEGRYWSMDEIEESLGKSVLTPNFEGEFARIRHSLEALL